MFFAGVYTEQACSILHLENRICRPEYLCISAMTHLTFIEKLHLVILWFRLYFDLFSSLKCDSFYYTKKTMLFWDVTYIK